MDDPRLGVVEVVAGGAGGSVLVSALVRAGVAPWRAAAGVAVGGATAALVLGGRGRAIGTGVAAASVARLVLMWLESRAAHEAPAQREGIRTAFERARRELADEKADVTGRDEDVAGGDGGVGVSEHDRGGGVPEVQVYVGNQECGGEGRARAEREGAEGIAPVHGGGAASLCEGEGAALRSRAEWDAWRERGA